MSLLYYLLCYLLYYLYKYNNKKLVILENYKLFQNNICNSENSI